MAICCAVLSCSNAAVVRPLGECLSTYLGVSTAFPPSTQAVSSTNATTTEEYFTKVHFANDFEVKYYGSFKVLTNLLAKETYVLYQCGTPKPAYMGAAKYFEIPLTAAQVAQTTVLGFMALLQVDNRISYSSYYAVDPCQQKLATACNKASEGLYSPRPVLDAQLVNSDALFESSASSSIAKSIAFSATSDNGPLNRAEWIKFLAMFFNQELLANALFDDIVSNYVTLKALAQGSVLPKKRAVFVYRAGAYTSPSYSAPLTWNIEWGVPYKRQLLLDAGAIVPSGTDMLARLSSLDPDLVPLVTAGQQKLSISNNALGGSNTALGNMTTLARILRGLLGNVDVLVDVSSYSATDLLVGYGMRPQDVTLDIWRLNWAMDSAADATAMPFLANDQVLRFDASVSTKGDLDWFEMAVARPDWVVRDLVAVIRPQAIDPSATTILTSYQPHFMRRVTRAVTQQYNPNQCINLVACKAPVTTICPLVWRTCSGALVHATLDQRCPANEACAQMSSGVMPSARILVSGLAGALLLLLLAMLA